MATELTERQKQFYRYVVEHLKENHSVPTMPAAANHFGIVLNAAKCHKDALIRKGWLVDLPERGKYKLGRGSVSVKTPCLE